MTVFNLINIGKEWGTTPNPKDVPKTNHKGGV